MGRGNFVEIQREEFPALCLKKTVCSLSFTLFFGSSIHSYIQSPFNPAPTISYSGHSSLLLLSAHLLLKVGIILSIPDPTPPSPAPSAVLSPIHAVW